MPSEILDPLREYRTIYQEKHNKNAEAFFDDVVKQ